MSLRLVQMVLPTSKSWEVDDLFDESEVVSHWVEDLEREQVLLVVLVNTKEAETVVSRLEERFSDEESFRIVILPVQATLPVSDEEDDEEHDAKEEEEGEKKKRTPPIPIEELRDKVTGGVEISAYFTVTVALSAFVAAIGVFRDDVAIVVGAMIIAPLFSPNMAMCLGTTLGEPSLVWRGARVNLLGIFTAFAASVIFGFVFGIDTAAAQVESRAAMGLLEFLLGAAAGAAGALSLTTGTVSGVVGVMIAVALLPPLVISGMLIGAGHPAYAVGPALLVTSNLICINIGGIVTFLVQGIRPRNAFDEEDARHAVLVGIAFWAGMAALLAGLLFFFQDYARFP